jgi:hypothetical protein
MCVFPLAVFLSVLLLALFGASCSSEKKDLLYVQPKGGASLYQEPTADSQVLALVPVNGAVEPQKGEWQSGQVDGLGGYWIPVRYKELEGWMFDRFLAEQPVTALLASYACPDDPYLLLNLYAGNTFMMKINLCEGIGTLYGTYAEEAGAYLMSVQRRDFSGFAGEDVQEFAFIKVSGDAAQTQGALRFTMTEMNSMLACGPFDGYLYTAQPLEQE